MEKIRVGLVGIGHRGWMVFALMCKFEGVEGVAVCDIKRDNWFTKQKNAQKAYCEYFPNTAFYDDYDEMLDKGNLDLVIVETGADIHADFCIKALEKNINVLSDIPNVASLEEAERLWQASLKSKAFISTGANPNYQRFVEFLNDFYQKGYLGKPYCMEAEYIHWSMPNSDEAYMLNKNGDWRKKLIPIRYCTHSLGPLLTILEDQLRYCSCFGTGSHSNDGSDALGAKLTSEEQGNRDDMMCANFKTESGVVIRLMRNGRCRAKIGHHNYRVFGTEGYVERIDRMNKPVIRYNSTFVDDNELKEIEGRFMIERYKDIPYSQDGHDGMDYAMLDAFLKAFREGKPAVTLKEGLLMTLPGIYAEESAKRNGEVIKMVYPWEEDWSTTIK